MNEQEYGEAVAHSQISDATTNNSANASQLFLEEKERGIVDIQLEVDTIKADIYHLLKQDVYKVDDQDGAKWETLKNKAERILSDWGVDRIMRAIHFYVNKNTLLSNFDENQIRTLMLRFVTELNDLMLQKYETLFAQPTFEECEKIIELRINDKIKLALLAAKMSGNTIDEVDVRTKLMKEMNLEKEVTKIKEEERKKKIRDYGLMMAEIETMVYATLNRAYRGEERGSIRRHTTISELYGQQKGNPPQEKGGNYPWSRG